MPRSREARELRARPDVAGPRDGDICQRQGRRSSAHRILHPVTGEMVRGQLGERGRGEGHRCNQGNLWRDAVQLVVVTPLPMRADVVALVLEGRLASKRRR